MTGTERAPRRRQFHAEGARPTGCPGKCDDRPTVNGATGKSSHSSRHSVTNCKPKKLYAASILLLLRSMTIRQKYHYGSAGQTPEGRRTVRSSRVIPRTAPWVFSLPPPAEPFSPRPPNSLMSAVYRLVSTSLTLFRSSYKLIPVSC